MKAQHTRLQFISDLHPNAPQRVIAGIFLHGQAEQLCGYDIPNITRGKLPCTPGVYHCSFVDESGRTHAARLFLWFHRTLSRLDRHADRKRYDYRGLIVRLGDRRNMADAAAKLRKRQMWL